MPDQHCTIPMLIVKTIRGRKKAVAFPFSDGCDIHCGKIEPDRLVEDLLKCCRTEKVNRLEFKGTTSFVPSGDPSHTYFGHKLDLTSGEKKLWSGLSSSKQRNINKSKNAGIRICFYEGPEGRGAIREFYKLHCLTRKRHGLPPQPLKFFDNIHRNIISENKGEIGLGYLGDTPVAGAVYLFCKDEVLFKFGASDKNHQHMRSNDLLMWEAIKHFSASGFKTLSFGKTEAFHEGLWRFKEGFGATRIMMQDHCYIVRSSRKIKETPGVHGIHNIFFKLMPVPLLRLSGELLYRYSA